MGDGLREFARRIAIESIPREWGPGAQRHRRHVLKLLDDALTTTPETAYANGRALSGDSRANGEPGPGGVYVTEERLAAALHEVYCRRNAPMHSAKDHSAALILAVANSKSSPKVSKVSSRALREADPS